jgi:hypothetical protein
MTLLILGTRTWNTRTQTTLTSLCQESLFRRYSIGKYGPQGATMSDLKSTLDGSNTDWGMLRSCRDAFIVAMGAAFILSNAMNLALE